MSAPVELALTPVGPLERFDAVSIDWRAGTATRGDGRVKAQFRLIDDHGFARVLVHDDGQVMVDENGIACGFRFFDGRIVT